MSQRKSIAIANGETKKVSWQWAGETEKRGTTVTSSSWAVEGSSCTTSNATLVTPLTEVTIACTSDNESGVLKNTVVLANGETLIDWAYLGA